MKRAELVELLRKAAAALDEATKPLDQFELARTQLGQVSSVVAVAAGTVSVQEGLLKYIAAKVEEEGIEP